MVSVRYIIFLYSKYASQVLQVLFYFYDYECFTCIYVCTICVQYLLRPEEGIGASVTSILEGCGQCVGAGD